MFLERALLRTFIAQPCRSEDVQKEHTFTLHLGVVWYKMCYFKECGIFLALSLISPHISVNLGTVRNGLVCKNRPCFKRDVLVCFRR